MISDFQQLAEKVNRLAELAHALRRENADLRRALAEASAEKAELTQRIDEAHRRVAALLDKIPPADQTEEAA